MAQDCLGFCLSQSPFYNLNEGWRWMFWSELIPCVLFLGLLFLVPKSPRWLILKGCDGEALDILNKIHGEEAACAAVMDIKESLDGGKVLPFQDMFKKSVFPIVVIGSVISALQQLTGINAILYFGADIFETALGFAQEDVLAQQILLAGVNFLFTLIALFSVDEWGRKPLMIWGSLGMVVGLLMVGFTLMTNKIGIFSLMGILMFIASFAMSMGPIVWVLLSEMFPNNIRSGAMSIAVVVQWAMNYVVSQLFPIVVESEVNNNAFWNGSLPYFIFIFFILMIIAFTMKYVPETKGKSLEELEKIWKQKYGELT